jgi:hypothetical protein
MTAQELINKALQTIGVISSGESPSTEESNDGLVTLNGLLASWSAQALPIYQIVRETVSMTGAGSYTLVTRPVKIKSAVFVNDGVETPYALVGAEDWASYTRNRVLYHDGGYPTGIIRLRPDPTAGTLELYSYQELTALGALSTTIALPPGYERALQFNLALDLAPEYGHQINEGLIGLANDSKLAIQGLNQAVLGAPVPQAPVTA